MEHINIVIVTAGLSHPSSTRALAENIGQSVTEQLAGFGSPDASITVCELRELAQELATAMTNWSAPTPRLDQAKEALAGAHGLIAVSPIFQASYSGLFKMFFDVLEPSALKGLPTIIGATAGSARHSLALDYSLRPLLSYMKALVVPTGIFQATEDFGTAEGARITARIERAAGELAHLILDKQADQTHGLTPNARPGGTDEDVIPMTDLLD